MKNILVSAVCCLILFPASYAKEDNKPLYKDKDAPIEQRVEDLLGRMTLHEKVLQLQNREAGQGKPDRGSRSYLPDLRVKA